MTLEARRRRRRRRRQARRRRHRQRPRACPAEQCGSGGPRAPCQGRRVATASGPPAPRAAALANSASARPRAPTSTGERRRHEKWRADVTWTEAAPAVYRARGSGGGCATPDTTAALRGYVITPPPRPLRKLVTVGETSKPLCTLQQWTDGCMSSLV